MRVLCVSNMKYLGPVVPSVYVKQARILILAHPVLPGNTSTGLHVCETLTHQESRSNIAVVAISVDNTVKGALSVVRTPGIPGVSVVRIQTFVLSRDASLYQEAMAWAMLHRAISSKPKDWLIIVNTTPQTKRLFDGAGFQETHRVHSKKRVISYGMVYGRGPISSERVQRLTSLDPRNTKQKRDIWRCSSPHCKHFGAYKCSQVRQKSYQSIQCCIEITDFCCDRVTALISAPEAATFRIYAAMSVTAQCRHNPDFWGRD